jgi:hypothetical protein
VALKRPSPLFVKLVIEKPAITKFLWWQVVQMLEDIKRLYAFLAKKDKERQK